MNEELPICELEVDGEKHLFFADADLGLYFKVSDQNYIVNAEDVSAPMEKVIGDYNGGKKS